MASPVPKLFVLSETNSDSTVIYLGLLWTKATGKGAVGSIARRCERSVNTGDASPIREEWPSDLDEEGAGKAKPVAAGERIPVTLQAASPREGPRAALSPRRLSVLIPPVSQ